MTSNEAEAILIEAIKEYNYYRYRFIKSKVLNIIKKRKRHAKHIN